MNTLHIKFAKFHGAGNDFIMIDNRSGFFPAENVDLVAFLCKRHLGIGADGLILIEEDPATAFYMRYYNADGKPGSFCGNGSRCAVLFAFQLKMFETGTIAFKSSDGMHEALFNAENENIRICMNVHTEPVPKLEGWFTHTGSPHFILFTDNIKNHAIHKEGTYWRSHPAFYPGGTNVNFVEINDNVLLINTFERGVEAETLACGTGVVAAALTARKRNFVSGNTIVVIAKGGILNVLFEQDKVWLSGPAKMVFYGEMEAMV